MTKLHFQPTGRSLPILNHVLYSAGSATSTSLDCWITEPCAYSGPPVLVPAEAIKTAFKMCKAPVLHADHIDAGGLRVPFTPGDLEAFPERAHSFAGAMPVTLPGLAAAVKLATHEAAKADVRYYLNGVLIEVKGGLATVVATDGHRLHRVQLAGTVSAPDMAAIVPIDHLKRISYDVVALSDGWIKCGDAEIQLIDARYPDWRRVMPDASDRPRTITADRDALQAALVRVRPLLNPKYHGVRLVMSASAITLEVPAADPAVTVPMPANGSSADPVTIGISADYLISGLKACPAGPVAIRYNDANGSILLGPDQVIMSMWL